MKGLYLDVYSLTLRLKNIDKAMIETITNEIQTNVSNVTWNDIAGLAHAKKSIQEVVVWPMLRPDLFHGIRAPPKGLLLFGPPGTGKTLIGKCIASQVVKYFYKSLILTECDIFLYFFIFVD